MFLPVGRPSVLPLCLYTCDECVYRSLQGIWCNVLINISSIFLKTLGLHIFFTQHFTFDLWPNNTTSPLHHFIGLHKWQDCLLSHLSSALLGLALCLTSSWTFEWSSVNSHHHRTSQLAGLFTFTLVITHCHIETNSSGLVTIWWFHAQQTGWSYCAYMNWSKFTNYSS